MQYTGSQRPGREVQQPARAADEAADKAKDTQTHAA